MSVLTQRLTLADLAQMPNDGKRYEIIDGEPHVSPAPSRLHEKLTVRLLLLIYAYLTEHGLGDDVYTAPVDVHFSGYDGVQPDLVYVSPARRSILGEPGSINGAPDLIVEIFSPSSRAYDQLVKARLYATAGVPELWHADPEAESLTDFALEGGAYVPVPQVDGRARSLVLPGLEIDVAALFADLA